MRPQTFRRAPISIIGAVLLLTSCAAQPARVVVPVSEEPVASEPSTSPIAEAPLSLADLVTSPEGLGTLRIGEPAASSKLIEFDPDHCSTGMDSASSTDSDPGRWLPTFPLTDNGLTAFAVNVDADGLVQEIDITSDEPATAEGIRIGSTIDELRSAYPDLRDDVANGGTATFLIEGVGSTLLFEVIVDPTYIPEAADEVYDIRILAPGSAWFGIGVGGDTLIGGCPF